MFYLQYKHYNLQVTTTQIEFIKRNNSPRSESLLKMYSPACHPRCRWVCFFIKTDLEKLLLHHLLTNALQWFGIVFIRREICKDQTLFTSKNNPKQFLTNMSENFHSRRQLGMDFFTGKHYYGTWHHLLDLIMYLFITNMQLFTSQYIYCWTEDVWITCELVYY